MKKDESKKRIKLARKAFKAKIQEDLMVQLLPLINENAKAKKKLLKVIKKGSAQLAEKISEITSPKELLLQESHSVEKQEATNILTEEAVSGDQPKKAIKKTPAKN